MTRPTTTGKAQDLITFTRSTTGTALAKISYGEELVINGDFSNGLSGWLPDPNASVINGQLVIDGISQTQSCYQNIDNLKPNTYYKFECDTLTDGSYIFGYSSFSNSSPITGFPVYNLDSQNNKIKQFVVFKTTDTGQFRIRAYAVTGHIAIYDNFSVKEVLYDQPDGTLQLFNHPINKPRIEYDASGNCLGLLVEEARTNLFRYSQELSNVSHALITTDNATVSPDGTQNASLCIPTSANVEHFIDDQTVTVGTDYAMSCFAKYGSGSYLLAFRGSGIGGNPPQFNLQTGTVVNEGASSVWSNTKIEDVGNGWYKCSSVGNPNATLPLRFQILRSDGETIFTGDGTGHYIWGAQIEQNSFPTSYIPTSGSTVTRAADIASLAMSEFGYNQDQGTVFINCLITEQAASNKRVIDGNSNNKRWMYVNNPDDNYGLKYFDGTNNIALLNSGIPPNMKAAVAVTPTQVFGAANSSAVGSGAHNGTLLDISQFNFFANLTGHIKSIQYYPLRLSNAQLQALTV